MEKKNTMLMTIIAVATLLVAIIGASFAYFTATTNDGGGMTIVTSTTETIASVNLNNPTETLKIKLTANDMAEDNLGTYWATDNVANNYDSNAIQRAIAVATVDEGGSATAKYKCSAKVNVALSGNMADDLLSGDAYIQFGGLLNTKVDLTEIDSDGYLVEFNLNGNTTKSQSVTAAIAMVNREVNQNHLAGKTLTVTFSNTDFGCQLIK